MRALLFVGCAAVALTGCVTTPETQWASKDLPSAYVARSPMGSRDGSFWNQFSDPLLLLYLDQADRANGDVRTAAARMAQARALLNGSRAALRPELNGSVSAGRRRASLGVPTFDPRDATLYDVGFDAQWELDLFERLGNEARAQAADAEASGLDMAAIRVTVAAETARLYFAVRALQLRIELSERSTAILMDLAHLARDRTSAGLVAETDAIQLEALADASLAQAAVLQAELAGTRAALALILGLTVTDLASDLVRLGELAIPASPMIGAPTDLLANRYDIRRDIARLEAADARAAARARDRLPRLTLGGTASLSSASGTALFTEEAITSSLTASIVGPILDFGRRRAVADQARSLADERTAILETTVLNAVREVERDAAAVSHHAMEAAARSRQAARSREAEGLLRQRYLAGLQDVTSVLQAERDQLSSADAEILARQSMLEATLSLWKSLGGDLL